MAAMALSGSTLPQVNQGGSVSGTLHIVTSDGAGPYKALLDTTGTGNFENALQMEVLVQVPGKKGNIHKGDKRRWVRILQRTGLMRRAATNVSNFPVSPSFNFLHMWRSGIDVDVSLQMI